MAKKADALKLAQESEGQAEVTNRRPATELAALSLMPARLQRLKIIPVKRKLPIMVDTETQDQIERPVKIRHAD